MILRPSNVQQLKRNTCYRRRRCVTQQTLLLVLTAKVLATITTCLFLFSATGTDASVSPLYEDVDSLNMIRQLSSADEVLKSDAIWMIQLYNPNQGESQEFAPAYKALAKLMKGMFSIAVIDVSNNELEKALQQLSIKKVPSSIPTVYIYGDDKKKPTKVGGRGKALPDIKMLAEALMERASMTITERSKSISHPGESQRRKSGVSDVVQLNGSNFDELVYNNPNVIAVAFTAPWCGHCKKLLPEWEEAASRLVGSGASLGWVDATIDENLARQYGVTGYPTIKIFPGGVNKKPKDANDYQYERSAPTIVKFMLQEVDKTGVPPPIPELTNTDVLEQTCGGHNKICIVAALPHILDSGAVGREKYRATLGAVAKQFRGTAFTFLWYEYTSQPDFEKSMELSFGAPAVVALSIDRKAYSLYRSSFNEKGITGFLHSITNGRQKTVPLPNDTIPTIQTVVPWDGKDGQPIEEEMSLDDIMGDEF